MRVPGNLLLDALSDAQYRKLEPHLEVVPLPVGRVLSGSDDRPTHVHFPTTGIVSVQMALEDGASEEVAVTGNEGLIGVSAFLEHGRGGAPPRPSGVQHAGPALGLPGRFVAEQIDRDGEFQRVLLRYTQALITQVAQTVVCNRHHRIAQQLCRWLLLRLDRLPVGEINATQERIAALLGVRHEGITAAVADLRRVELIRLQRGRLTVLDRSGLERKACECYAVIRKEYARLLTDKRASRSSQQRSSRRRETLELK
jgi:CRP-like cAMP-binding protein